MSEGRKLWLLCDIIIDFITCPVCLLPHPQHPHFLELNNAVIRQFEKKDSDMTCSVFLNVVFILQVE